MAATNHPPTGETVHPSSRSFKLIDRGESA